ncbi:MAG: class I SAM-dependent rRNA methyltransferase [Myxococcales bacterium]|nr:class I SAM-dependent rRNA methyltransferase [Myxococcales bacterium]
MAVSRRGLDSVRRGHPWLFRSAVVQVFGAGASKGGPPVGGSIVNIVDEAGQALGCGIWDPVSPIAVRVWSLDPSARLDSQMFRARLERAIEVRRRLFADGLTTAYRLLNGEGDRVPAFVVDRYADVAVLRIDGDAAKAVSAELLRDVEAPLRAHGITTLLERTGRRGEAPEIRPLFGPAREKVEVKEHGIPFIVDLARGQKTGAFLDQRENRRRIGELVARRARSSGRPVRVLNLFSYTGGFSLHAALAGGTVTSVDVAMAAHATAQESFRLAGVDPRAHTFVSADCFAWLEAAAKRGDRWDVVISDPPSFAPSEKAKPKGLAAYRSLHRACADVLAEGGTFVAASCSSHVTAEDFAGTLDDAALGRADLRLLEQFGPPADHPTLPAFPEGRYLKLVVLE